MAARSTWPRVLQLAGLGGGRGAWVLLTPDTGGDRGDAGERWPCLCWRSHRGDTGPNEARLQGFTLTGHFEKCGDFVLFLLFIFILLRQLRVGSAEQPQPRHAVGTAPGARCRGATAGGPPKPRLPSSTGGFLLHWAHLQAVVAARAWGGDWHCCYKRPAKGSRGFLLPAGGLLGGSAHPLEVQQR